ncbi:hypothetical protein CAC42_63 [Sphaceloma murrayae]|uniref:Rhodopsin domain-containing protein n=1 Tax=Sphaceloma murrayae TaxID=2082308 RepID=A0A2K1QNY8_9PEZI|nr:hypothetical protein CAC42_63 [Sphaceloma murrayae]
MQHFAALAADVLVKKSTASESNKNVGQFTHLYNANIIITTITLFSVFLRVFVRRTMLKQFGREDWAMVVTAVLYIVHTTMTFMTTMAGMKFLRTGNIKLLSQLALFGRIGNGFFALTMVALKFSLGFFFLRIIGHQMHQRYIIWIILIITTLSGGLYFGFATFTCATIKDVSIVSGPKCPLQRPSIYVYATFSIVNIVGDFFLTLIGVSALVQAKLPTITKMVAGSLLAFSCVGGIATTIRLVYVLQPVDLAIYISQLFNAGLWYALESAVGIIAVNFAMMRPIFQAFLEKMHLVSTQTNTNTKTFTAPDPAKSAVRYMGTMRDHGKAVLQDEIRKDTTVIIVDEEKGSLETMRPSQSHAGT